MFVRATERVLGLVGEPEKPKPELAAGKTLASRGKRRGARASLIAPHRAQIITFTGGMGARQSISADEAPETGQQDALIIPREV